MRFTNLVRPVTNALVAFFLINLRQFMPIPCSSRPRPTIPAGRSPVSVPGTNNVNIPTIDPGVTLTPNPASPRCEHPDGPTEGRHLWALRIRRQRRREHRVGKRQRYRLGTGLYQLIWEVAGADPKIGSAHSSSTISG